jgi:hypothetical protein
MSLLKIEKQPYTVVLKAKGFEVRQYPPALLATVYSTAKTYKELASPGFRKIANYIFGNNTAGTKIAMTAPVHINMNSEQSSMSFVMPAKYDENNLPKPISSEVKIHKAPEEYVAVITFGGYTSDEKIESYSQALQQMLNENNIRTKGYFRFLGYNAPYQFIGRKNEVIVSVEWPDSVQ